MSTIQSRFVSSQDSRFYLTDLPDFKTLGKASHAPSHPHPKLSHLEHGQSLNSQGRAKKTIAGLTPKETAQLKKLYPIYKEAERRTGVDWRILAGIHYRESDFGLNAAAKHNPFQFSGSNLKHLKPTVLENAVEVGKMLQRNAKRAHRPPLVPGMIDGANVRQAVFRYNGTKYKVPEKSPYVMNQFDEKHQRMGIVTRDHGSIDGIDRRMGVLRVAENLRGF